MRPMCSTVDLIGLEALNVSHEFELLLCWWYGKLLLYENSFADNFIRREKYTSSMYKVSATFKHVYQLYCCCSYVLAYREWKNRN